MRLKDQQIIKQIIEKIRCTNDSLTVTTSQVQEAVNLCNFPQWLKTILLWIAAITLRKRGMFSFLKAYIVICSTYIITRPSIWEAVINSFFTSNVKVRNILLTIVQIFDGAVDKMIFGTLTVVVIIVVTYHFIIKYQENKVHNELKTLIDEITFKPEKKWFDKKCNIAISTLGNRYSSEINYKNPHLSTVYKALVTPDKWILSFRKSLQTFIKESKHLYDKLPSPIKEQNVCIHNNISYIIDIYNNKQYNKFAILFNNIRSIFQQFRTISNRNRDEFPNYKISSLEESFRNIESNASIYKFFSKPVLYVKGDAGSGKSHFLADIVNTRMEHHLKSLFALGLQFNQIEDIRDRLMNIWCVKGSWDDFLDKLNKIGEIEKHRILIIIDGINEGLGNHLWPNVLAGIEADILQYPNLGLIISARTFSNTNMLDEISKDKATITMEGFQGMEDEAIKYMTGKFGVTFPQISNFRKEFANPLFLKLYCQAYSSSTATMPKSFLDVIKHYLGKVNEKLASKYNYQAALYNYTQQVANVLTELYALQKTTKMVKFHKLDDVLKEVKNILPNNIVHSYLQELVSDGVLISYIDKQGEILIDFNFDLVGDYMYAAALIDKQWKEYIGRIFDNGIYEATCVLLPLMKGIEITNYHISNISYEHRLQLFIDTLKQRFSISLDAIIEIEKIKNIDLDLFYEILPVLATHSECHSIIGMVNNELKGMSMVERDQKWSMHFTINHHNPSRTELIKFSKWAASISRKSASIMPDIVAKQAACILMWSFSSPYRLLRDVATKATINLLQDKPNVLIDLVDFFDDVNDPYIQQRLYAVVHGCVYRGKCCESVELGKKVFEAVFNTPIVRPDILLRDYARCAIDFINQCTPIDGINIKKIEPPYGVNFNFNQCPKRETVESKYHLDETMGFDKKTVFTQNKILSSMETEYSNGVCGYGDFGRYTFEAYLRSWEDCEGYSASLLRNYALDIIFEKYKFNANVYKQHDYIINKLYRGNRPVMERFGKKFQWIALYEILGLLQDNYKMELWESNNKNVQCNGTWDPNVRDIDTTNTFFNYYNEDNLIPKYEPLEWTHVNNIPFKVKHKEKWLTSNEGMSKELVSKSIIVKDDKGEEWIVLYGYNTITSESSTLTIDEDEIGLWEFIQAYTVHRKNRNNVAKLIHKKGTQSRDMPEYRNDIYCLFYKDYYRSASYREYAKRTMMDDWKEFNSPKTLYQIGYRPYSFEGEMSAYRLNKLLYSILNLKDGEKEGEYIDINGKVVAFDPSVKFESGSQLLVRKKELLIALKQHKLSLVWPLLFEKQIGTTVIGCQFGGSAWITDNGKIKVKMRLYDESRFKSNKDTCCKVLKNYAKFILSTVRHCPKLY